MAKSHSYEIRVTWTGNTGAGTSSYTSYGRDHLISGSGKSDIAGSADSAFRGAPSRYNPEELLVAALSTCHMLSYLHLCAIHGLNVQSYEDDAHGTMEELPGGSGHFTSVVLHPTVRFLGSPDLAKAAALHEEAHHNCFIANSVNFPVLCQPRDPSL